MFRKLMFGFALTAGAGLTVGCEASKDSSKEPNKTMASAKSTGEMMKERMDKGKEALKDGADKGKDAVNAGVEKGKEAAKDGADAAKAMMDKAKTELVKPMEDLYPKIEEKIKGLTGETSTKATAAFAAVKKLVEEFKASPADKYKELMGGLTSKFDELKKMVGL